MTFLRELLAAVLGFFIAFGIMFSNVYDYRFGVWRR